MFFLCIQMFLYSRKFYYDKAKKRLFKRFFAYFFVFCEKIFIHFMHKIQFKAAENVYSFFKIAKTYIFV